ncbi:DUF1127 domain-containing protein [Phyllobacterium sp. K27]
MIQIRRRAKSERRLSTLDDHLLEDLGLSREQAIKIEHCQNK